MLLYSYPIRYNIFGKELFDWIINYIKKIKMSKMDNQLKIYKK